MMRAFTLSLLISLGALAPAQAAEPSLVGNTWTTVIPDATGGQHVFLHVRTDGSYTMYSPAYGSAGLFTVTPPNRWQMVATTKVYADHGTFRISGDKLYLSSADFHTTGTWSRVARPPAYTDVKLDHQYVPSGVPTLVQRVILIARKRWRADAIPVGLAVEKQPADMRSKAAYYSLEVSIYSPSSHTGWDIDLGPYYTQDVLPLRSTGNMSKIPLSPEFADLPQAIETARRAGMTQFVSALVLGYRKFGTMWRIRGRNGLYQVSGRTGKLSNADLTGGYIAAYNRQWDRAIKGLKRLLQQENGTDRCRGLPNAPPFCMGGVAQASAWMCPPPGAPFCSY